MKYKLIILSAILAISCITYSQPTAIVQFYGGYSMPLPDLKGSFGTTANTWTGNGNPDTNTYFMKSGINYGILMKFPIKKKSPVKIVGGIGFDVFSNSIAYNDTTGTADISLTQSLLGVVLGAEYCIQTKKSKINPFFGAEAMVNVFGGKLTIIYPDETKTFNMNSTIRLGFQVGGGVDFVLHNNIGLVVGAKYTFANLIGKSYQTSIGSKYSLGDAEYELNGATYPKKNITFLHFYGGMSFYFGR